MGKKAFTLIELLAVIVIISIIALIAIPIILNVVEESKKGALKNSAYGIIKAGENYIIKEHLKGNEINQLEIELPGFDKLEYGGKKPNEGKLVIDKEGNSSIVVIDGNFCAIKKLDSDIVLIFDKNDERCELDIPETVESCFDFDEETASITYYMCGSRAVFEHISEVRIPSKIKGIAVKSLGSSSFHGDSYLERVIIPNTVEKIESSAFAFSENLKKVVLSDEITEIAEYTFSYTGLKEIKLPKKITKIGQHAFLYSKLERIELPDSIIELGMGSFAMNNLKNISIPQNIEEIPALCFAFNKIETIEFNEKLKKIEMDAFDSNNLKKLKLPELLEIIEENVFHDNPVENVVVEGECNRFDSDWSLIFDNKPLSIKRCE